jgi:hypothetical protein
MTLDIFVALAQILGSIAVFVTVIFLALQVRENTRTNTVMTRQFVDDGWLEVTRLVAQDPEVARIYRDGLKDLSVLNSEDQWRFGALMQLALVSYQNRFLFGQDTPYDRQLQRYRLLWLVGQAGPRAWWQRARQAFEPRFQAHVDELLATVDEGQAPEKRTL